MNGREFGYKHPVIALLLIAMIFLGFAAAIFGFGAMIWKSELSFDLKLGISGFISMAVGLLLVWSTIK